MTVAPRNTRVAGKPATPLSHVPIGRKTGGFAPPPHGGFALTLRSQLALSSTQWQRVCRTARRKTGTARCGPHEPRLFGT
jgi:hypothetical protein